MLLLVKLALSAASAVLSLATCLPPPVMGAQLVERFDAPPCEFCAGHRGLEFAVRQVSPVVAVAAGVVTFAGTVAGVRYVVVQHDVGGLLATYGMLDVVDTRTDAHVSLGERLGVVRERMYFGLRRDGMYIDPEPLLGTVIRRPRLVPIDGTPGRPAEPGTLRCDAAPPRNLVVRPAQTVPRPR